MPGWLQRLLEWLSHLFAPVAYGMVAAWPVLKWVLVAIGIALLALVAWRLLAPRRRKKDDHAPAESGWVPEETAARELLAEADRLAAAGHFDEATHLLLQRSVGQIAEIRPDLVENSTTAREIAALPALPDNARRAFAAIAERVESSLFALRRLSAQDWQAARAAYADFALGYRGVAP